MHFFTTYTGEKPRLAILVILSLSMGLAGCSSDQPSTMPNETPQRVSGELPALEYDFAADENRFTYVEENDTVRIVAGYEQQFNGTEENPESEPVHSTVPWEEWAETRGAVRALEPLGEHFESRLGSTENINPMVHTGEDRISIRVAYVTHKARDGSVISSPTVPFSEVVDETPSEVRVRITLEGNAYSTTYPVFVQNFTQTNT